LISSLVLNRDLVGLAHPTINIEIVAADVWQDEVDAAGDFASTKRIEPIERVGDRLIAEAAGKLVVLKKGEMADRAAVLGQPVKISVQRY